jgi:hypothetical protein
MLLILLLFTLLGVFIMEVESICGDDPSDQRGDYVNEHAVVAD